MSVKHTHMSVKHRHMSVKHRDKSTRWHKTSFFSWVTAEIGKEVRVKNTLTAPRWLPRLPEYET